jgi:PTH2 family peptidyl-tRNA hydrolase
MSPHGDGMTGASAFKQVLLVRRDLRMSLGKAVAQGGHAAVAGLAAATTVAPAWVEGWLADGQPKVALRVDSEADLEAACASAERARLPVAMIRDDGRTQLPPGTLTCAAIGPAPADRIDEVTGEFSLL